MLKRVEITILAENRVATPLLIAEQGLSFHIASPEGQFLFDTGSRDAFIHNAEQLKIDLRQVEKIVFSHGHRDHTGGLYYYLQKFGSATVICHYNIFNRKFRMTPGGRLEVGIPQEEKELIRMGGHFVYKTHPYHISESILTTGEIPRVTKYEKPAELHQELVLESYITDEVKDDMALAIKTVRGLIVLLGDSHSGPVNSVKQAMIVSGEQKVHAIMGGMKLVDAPMEKIEKIARGLKQINPEYLVPLHSTGFRAISHFYRIFKERLLLFNTGDRLVIGE